MIIDRKSVKIDILIATIFKRVYWDHIGVERLDEFRYLVPLPRSFSYHGPDALRLWSALGEYCWVSVAQDSPLEQNEYFVFRTAEDAAFALLLTAK